MYLQRERGREKERKRDQHSPSVFVSKLPAITNSQDFIITCPEFGITKCAEGRIKKDGTEVNIYYLFLLIDVNIVFN
jgi:hypothetical protein